MIGAQGGLPAFMLLLLLVLQRLLRAIHSTNKLGRKPRLLLAPALPLRVLIAGLQPFTVTGVLTGGTASSSMQITSGGEGAHASVDL